MLIEANLQFTITIVVHNYNSSSQLPNKDVKTNMVQSTSN